MEAEVRAWRVRERARLKQERQRLSPAERSLLAEAVASNLDSLLEQASGGTLGLYWPIQSELDLRGWAQQIGARKGWTLALPVVTQERAPLEYWRWRTGDPMTRGFWGIMTPARREPIVPDIVLAPLVGFSGLYRLGHGGGYFDRTLAALRPKPLTVGVGTEAGRIAGFRPEPHDIPMDVIVTEAAIHREPSAGGERA